MKRSRARPRATQYSAQEYPLDAITSTEIKGRSQASKLNDSSRITDLPSNSSSTFTSLSPRRKRTCVFVIRRSMAKWFTPRRTNMLKDVRNTTSNPSRKFLPCTLYVHVYPEQTFRPRSITASNPQMHAIKRAEATDNFRVLPFALTMSLSKWPAMNSGRARQECSCMHVWHLVSHPTWFIVVCVGLT